MSKAALEGLKCIGFTYAGVGNIVIKYLVEHGATAVRIESMKRLDNTRVSAPYKDNKFGVNRSGYYAWINNDRYSLALNMKHPRAMEVCEKLIKWADILVENFTPGTLESWNLGYDNLRKLNPSIIVASFSQQGQTGPHRLMPGYGGTLQGLAGFTHITGWPDRWPVQVDRSYPDFIAPRFGVASILAALDYRQRTDKGQYIDVSEYEDCLHFLAPVLLDYVVNKKIQGREGNKSPYAAPHGCYRCQGEDKWCVVSIFTDGEWRAFCKAIGKPEWLKEPKFSTLLKRKKNEEELNGLIEQWTLDHTREEVVSILQVAGVAAGIVRTSADVENCPQLKHRHYFWMLNHPEIGEHLYARTSFLLSKTPAQLKMAAPCLGQHTEYVCKDILGMSEEEYVNLLIDNVFE
ncbi:MAG: CoA transferase [Dehalococcoidia bacterium]|jgi:benzylsuccinate CoA-transferase BbsF subunit